MLTALATSATTMEETAIVLQDVISLCMPMVPVTWLALRKSVISIKAIVIVPQNVDLINLETEFVIQIALTKIVRWMEEIAMRYTAMLSVDGSRSMTESVMKHAKMMSIVLEMEMIASNQ